MSEWNQQQEEADAEEKIDRCVKFSDHVALVVSERKRAFEAWQKAQQLQSEIDALKAAHAWINASERLPENGAKVLAIVREVMILVYESDTEFPGAPWRTENADIVFNKSSIVKWMPLPEPPK